MQQRIYSIYDNKADGFCPPFFMQNDAMAKRAISNTVNDPTTNVHHNPEDFVLYAIGTFDDGTGLISQLDPIQNLGIATHFKHKNEDETK